jgi:DNA (cytosine-5)-methyltransferase 1
LDLFCGAGGAAMGYARAGFEVVGVDIRPQSHYPFEFWEADALGVLTSGSSHGFDAIHASPPCQAFIRSGMVAKDGRHQDLLTPTRVLLESIDRPWVIENVPGAPMRPDTLLCGSMFGLAIKRHRWFEGSPALEPWTLGCNHSEPITGVYGHPHGKGGAWRNGTKPMLPSDHETWSREMGIDWMTVKELTQAIPPAYTEWVGVQLLRTVGLPA